MGSKSAKKAYKGDFLKWNVINQYIPEPGHAIVWIAPDGRQINGCVTIVEHKGVIDITLEYQFLPLITYDKEHIRDQPIDYIPSLWRYK
jgi:hypothetical protein